METDKQLDDMEQRIIDAACELFVQKGFVETSMSDIAARVGVNRPAINYYFRTKERLFQAVLGNIVGSFVPRVVGTIAQQNLPLRERISRIVDIYFSVFLRRPFLPLFVLRELNRDFSLIANTVDSLGMADNLRCVKESIEREMQCGLLKSVPMRVAIGTFTSLLVTPFAGRPLVENCLLREGEGFQNFLDEWKPNIVDTMCRLLENDSNKEATL